MKPLSPVAIFTLRYIHEHVVTDAHLPAFRMTTIYSFLYRGYVTAKWDARRRILRLRTTELGKAALDLYNGININIWRKEKAAITRRVARMLRSQSHLTQSHPRGLTIVRKRRVAA